MKGFILGYLVGGVLVGYYFVNFMEKKGLINYV